MKIIVGVDPGLNGGIAYLSETQSEAIVMPLLDGKLDTDTIHEYFRFLKEVTTDVYVYIEKLHSMPKQGVASTFRFGYDAGLVRGIVEGLRLPVRMVGPVTWKKLVLGGNYNHTKEGAIAFCQDTYPTIALIPQHHRVPHTGIADAICIATYGWKKEFKHGRL